jgi:hypothetical protein
MLSWLSAVSPKAIRIYIFQPARSCVSSSFCMQISYEQLQRVDPAFSRITQGQLNILVKALNTLPAASWDALIHMVQGLGPVTDVVVAAHQMTGQLPTNPGNRPEETNAVIQWKPLRSIINLNVATQQQQQQRAKGARKLLQSAEEDAAAAALAAAALAAASQEGAEAPAAAPVGPPPVGYCKTSDEVSAAVSRAYGVCSLCLSCLAPVATHRAGTQQQQQQQQQQ